MFVTAWVQRECAASAYPDASAVSPSTPRQPAIHWQEPAFTSSPLAASSSRSASSR